MSGETEANVAEISIHRTHPNFFYELLGLSVSLLSIGVLLLLTPEQGVKLYAFTAPFFVIPPILFFGLLRPSYRWVRLGLILGAAYSTFFAIWFVIAAFRVPGQAKALAFLLPPWGLMSLMFLISIKEPPVNPASDRRKWPR